MDAAGNFYVADQGRVQKFDSDGNFITKWGSVGTGDGQFSGWHGIAVDAGNVYVADSSNYRIQKFTVLKVTRADLGIWTGDQHSIAWDINDLAQIAGGSGLDTVNFRNALLWNGAPEPKKNLGVLDGFASSEAKDINNHGQVVGVSRDMAGLRRGFLWFVAEDRNEVMQDLGALGGEGAWSSANAINNLGQVVGSSETASGPEHAFLWEAGDMQDLGALVVGNSSASDINDNGQVVGWHIVSFMRHAVLWETDGSITDLHAELPAGSDSSEATAINDAGQVVGLFHHPDTGFSAFLYDGSMQVLETSRNRVTLANDIDNFGQVVGIRGGMEVGDLAQAVICYWDKGPMEMQVLPPLESGRSGFAWGMNNRGQVVGMSSVGSTIGDPGDSHAVLWEVTLPPPPMVNLIDRIDTGVVELVQMDVLNRGEGNSLITKLDGIKRRIGVKIGDLMLAEKTLAEAKESNLKAACNLLQAFINEVDALIRSGRLSQFAGDYLIQQAELAIDSIWAENALP